MKTQKLSRYTSRRAAIDGLLRSHPNAKRKGDRWVSGSIKLWIDSEHRIIIDYGKQRKRR